MNEEIKTNIEKIKSQITAAEITAGRKPGSVKLLAVSKFHPAESVYDAISAGQIDFGENRVQEACSKFPEIIEKFPNVNLHIIGQLQTNKVKKAVQIASMIESVDRLELVKEIEKQCAKIDKKIEILFEFHTGEESKSGYKTVESLEETLDFIAQGNAPHIIPKGFMTMAPLTENTDEIKKSFLMMKQIAEKMQEKYNDFELTELSMGMSHDFKIAIEAGSTEVRVGTAIFGQRA